MRKVTKKAHKKSVDYIMSFEVVAPKKRSSDLQYIMFLHTRDSPPEKEWEIFDAFLVRKYRPAQSQASETCASARFLLHRFGKTSGKGGKEQRTAGRLALVLVLF